MNTKVTVTSAYKSNDNLIILSDHKNISGFSSFLNADNTKFLKSAAQKEVPYVIFPSQGRLIIVQFLKENGTESISREDARLAGNEMLNQLGHYKANSVVLINQRKSNRSLDYLEGMILGNYQFLKYFNDKIN